MSKRFLNQLETTDHFKMSSWCFRFACPLLFVVMVTDVHAQPLPDVPVQQLPEFRQCTGANRSVQFTLISSMNLARNWTSANQFCQSGGSAFRLAAPQSKLENNCIFQLGTNMSKQAFLGIRNSSTYKNFYNSSSSGCPAISLSSSVDAGKWVNVNCSQSLPFVCERVPASRCDFSNEDEPCPFLSFSSPDANWEISEGHMTFKSPGTGSPNYNASVEFLESGTKETEFPCNVSLRIMLDNKNSSNCSNWLANVNKQQNWNILCKQWTTVRWTLQDIDRNISNLTSQPQSRSLGRRLFSLTLPPASVVFVDNATATCSSERSDDREQRNFNVTYTCTTNTTKVTSQTSCDANKTCTVVVKKTCLNVTSCTIQASGLGRGQAQGISFKCGGNNTLDPLHADCFSEETPQNLSPCLGRCERSLQLAKIAGQVVPSTASDESRTVWTVTCDDGHETNLKKTTNITCNTTTGEMMPSPICSPVKCSSLPLMENAKPLAGAYNKSIFSFGQEVNSSCSHGYWLKVNKTYVESATFKCVSGGLWQPSLLCEAYCTNPDKNLSNVMVSMSDTRMPITTMIVYNCSKSGQAVNGTMESWTATCQANGLWDKLLPCKDVQCRQLVVSRNVAMSTKQVVYGTVVVFTCENENDTIEGGDQTDFTLQCEENGEWNGTEPTCKEPPTPTPKTASSSKTASPTTSQSIPTTTTSQSTSPNTTNQSTSPTTTNQSVSPTTTNQSASPTTTNQSTSPTTTNQSASPTTTSQSTSPTTTSLSASASSIATTSQPPASSYPSTKPTMTSKTPTPSQKTTSPTGNGSVTSYSSASVQISTLQKSTSSDSSTTTEGNVGGTGKQKSDDDNVAAIGGAAGGAVVLLILIIVVIILWKKRSGGASNRKPSLRAPNNRNRSDEVRLSAYRKSSDGSSLNAMVESSSDGHEDTYSHLQHSGQTFGMKKSASGEVVPNNELNNKPGRTSTTSQPNTKATNDTYAHLDRRSGTSQIIGGTSTFLVNPTSDTSTNNVQDDKAAAYSEVVTANKTKKESVGQSDGATPDYESVRPSVPTKTDSASVLYEEAKPGSHPAEGGQSKDYAEVMPRSPTNGANALTSDRGLEYIDVDLSKPLSSPSGSAPPKQVTEYSTVVVNNATAES